MPVVLNEAKQAEEIIRTGEVGAKPSSTLFLLGKYYRQKMGLSKDATVTKLNEFMEQNYKNYNSVLWEEIIESISKKSIKYQLREINFVGITEYELSCIRQLKNIKYEKLIFTMLCHAKYYNFISENNNGWVNIDIPEIFRVSRVSVKYQNDKFLYLNEIEQNKILSGSGLISFSSKNDNLNIRINFVDMDGEPILYISDFRELGYEYLNYYNLKKFKRCENCNRLFALKSKNDGSSKYCLSCKKTKDLEKKRKWWSSNKIPLDRGYASQTQ